MSLINQALKRAQEAQQQTPPPATPTLHFRPVEASQRSRHNLGLVLQVGMAVVALLLLFLVWQLVQKQREATSIVAGATSANHVAATAEAPPTVPQPANASTPPQAEPEPVTASPEPE